MFTTYVNKPYLLLKATVWSTQFALGQAVVTKNPYLYAFNKGNIS